ncbi:MAG: GtrA family protein [Clostridia bacterium]|nr:GtrA family protein [Clostridia bacterium]
MNILKQILKDKFALSKYFLYSVIVAVIDTIIVWLLTRQNLTHLVMANTIGVSIGFVLHYLLSSKSVFKTRYSVIGFIIYLGTFFVGLFVANWLIYVSYQYIFVDYMMDLRILLSKGVSIIVPFFLMYFLRRYLFFILNRKEDK